MSKENQNDLQSTMFTVKEVSERWKISLSGLYNMIRAGAIPTITVPGGKRIPCDFVYETEKEAIFNPRPQTKREKELEQEVLRLSQELDSKKREIERMTSIKKNKR